MLAMCWNSGTGWAIGIDNQQCCLFIARAEETAPDRRGNQGGNEESQIQ